MTKVAILVLFCFYKSFSAEAIEIPSDFMFGAATAAYQVEGAWNESGKGESIWDNFTHAHPSNIADHSNGDVACDSYHLWESDIEILKELGVNHYRFSISWPRLLPDGLDHYVNQDGVTYYNNLIDALVANNITPMVTLYHWDLPQNLQDFGGWLNETTADHFANYARVAFGLFGDRVKFWMTMNEPSNICISPYESGNGAPPIKMPGIGCYICTRTVLLAHAKAYHLYDEEFRSEQQGKIGIAINCLWAEPATDSEADIEAAEREKLFGFGWFAHPIYSSEGDYPEVMKTRIAEFSARENFTESRLPPFSTEEVEYLKGSADFLGLNHYKTWLAKDDAYNAAKAPSWQNDRGVSNSKNSSWEPSEKITPWGLRKVLNWIKDEFNNPLLYIVENGIGESTGTLNDTERITYLQGYIKAAVEAATEDGCNVKGYTVWALMDNFEWWGGYTSKMGLFHVDFSSPNKTRTIKNSGKFYKEVISSRQIE